MTARASSEMPSASCRRHLSGRRPSRGRPCRLNAVAAHRARLKGWQRGGSTQPAAGGRAARRSSRRAASRAAADRVRRRPRGREPAATDHGTENAGTPPIAAMTIRAAAWTDASGSEAMPANATSAMAARAGGPRWTARPACRAAPRGPPQSSAWRCRPRPRAPPPPAPRPRRPSRAPPHAGRRPGGPPRRRDRGRPAPRRPLPASRPPPRTRTGRARAWRGGGAAAAEASAPRGWWLLFPDPVPAATGCRRGHRAPGSGGSLLGGGGKGPDIGRQDYALLAGHEAGTAYDDVRRPVRSNGPRVGLAGQGGISGGGPPRPGAVPGGGGAGRGGRGRDGLARAKRGGRPGVQCRRGGWGTPAGSLLPSLPHTASGAGTGRTGAGGAGDAGVRPRGRARAPACLESIPAMRCARAPGRRPARAAPGRRPARRRAPPWRLRLWRARRCKQRAAPRAGGRRPGDPYAY